MQQQHSIPVYTAEYEHEHLSRTKNKQQCSAEPNNITKDFYFDFNLVAWEARAVECGE